MMVFKDRESNDNVPLFVEMVTEKEFVFLKDAVENHQEYKMTKTEGLKKIYSIDVQKNGKAQIIFHLWRKIPSVMNVWMERIFLVKNLIEMDDKILINLNTDWFDTIKKTIYDYAISDYNRLEKRKNGLTPCVTQYLKYFLSIYPSQTYLCMRNIFYADSFVCWFKKKGGTSF